MLHFDLEITKSMLQPSYYLSRDCSQNFGLYSECLQLWGTACGGAAMGVAANGLL